MKIIVYAVPATEGGALTILNQYYDAAVTDVDNDWIFVVSKPKLSNQRNVLVLNYPWIKKSWFHRYFFDNFIAPGIARKHAVDDIISLQNVLIPRVNIKQTLYLHQPLPFLEKRFRMTENFRFWMYQNIISRLIFRSVKDADKVIVQTKWFKDTVIEKLKIDESKVVLRQPELSVNVREHYKSVADRPTTFFYPAGSMLYKNHSIIVQACTRLKRDGIENYRVVFTIQGKENKHVRKVFRIVEEEGLPIEFLGAISIDQVYDYYTNSTLLFPSYIETFGLPLLEAKVHGAPIIASDCAFSHEILNDYEKAEYFNPFDAEQLTKLMKSNINPRTGQ